MDGDVICMLMHGRCCDAVGEPELLEGPRPPSLCINPIP